MTNSLSISAAVFLALSALGASACDVVDPAEIPVHNPRTGQPRYPEGGTTSIIGDGGASGGTGAFAKAPPFTPGAATLNSVHATHQAQFGVQDPFERNCLDCHKAGGDAGTKPWAAAGSVRANSTAVAPAVGVEVGILTPTGQFASAYTDNAGNFVIQNVGGSTDVPAGSIAGVRNASTSRTMATPFGGGAANTGCMSNASNCHGTTATLKVYLNP